MSDDTRETHQRAKIIAKTSAGVLSGNCRFSTFSAVYAGRFSIHDSQRKEKETLINRSSLSNSSTYLLVRFLVLQSVTILLSASLQKDC
ncbi:hypothetical protein L1987_76201 [Smallanthus sonchifolius]|uniref:Uncharacterized protein n=1 Tax=Smallanthus sonchifolius TaxID=185202 RepID=A0ACB9A6W1_9ASTR|nr:hypothetical protein L1987_76201 [Smallanthus sonchifolius]